MTPFPGKYAHDINNPGWIAGWGIVKDDEPRKPLAMFPGEKEAIEALEIYGTGHSLRRMSHKSGTQIYDVGD